MRWFILFALWGGSALAAPVFLDSQFEMPAGFRIYKAAERELTGGSYALRFDGEGRLLVGDGTALRRLHDDNEDGVFDRFEVIATGLGWRGPQGILVYGDRLFAVGGDGVQMYEGYLSDQLRHLGRVGEKFRTGGDHDAHTLLRGHDGWIYLMAGNGSGLTNRNHITEANSPVRVEREASVFRFSPDGSKWECLATGGRNPPSLGMNYLGDLFSFDSDMEWHVGLPWYRPTRLNHWVIGGDQGWQDVGAYPPYFLDNLPGLMETGRGSPNWGIFYEHHQLPLRYWNSFLVCDYRWKGESKDDYRGGGRLVVFLFKRSESRWAAEMETLVRPKADAKDDLGRMIHFAVVDVDVAPDGSLYVTDHNQGVWRIMYDPLREGGRAPRLPASPKDLLGLLGLPQPGAEWSRRIEEKLSAIAREPLVALASSREEPVSKRLRAIRYLAPHAAVLSLSQALYRDVEPEIRAQAAWLAGISGGAQAKILPELLRDEDAFVRRRAAEGLLRHVSLDHLPILEKALNDPDRTVRYVAMMCLTHLPTDTWIQKLAGSSRTQVKLRAFSAAHLSGDRLPAITALRSLEALTKAKLSREDTLDFLRTIQLYEDVLKNSALIREWLLKSFPSADADISAEQARLMGLLEIPEAFPKLANEMSRQSNERQLHYFKALARLKSGWSAADEQKALAWALGTQTGWFAEFDGKGVEFSMFLQTALEDFAENHGEALAAAEAKILPDSLLRSAELYVLGKKDVGRLFDAYQRADSEEGRIKVLNTLARFRSQDTAAFLRHQLGEVKAPAIRTAAIRALRAMPKAPENEPFLREAIVPSSSDRSDDEIHKLILSADFASGDAARGRRVYERLQCNSCHAGGQTPGQEGRIFGPDLAGVTARLSRQELADSLVYPSKQVSDRYKALAITLKDGRELTGFVTERASDHVTFVDAASVHRLNPGEVVKSAPQEKSLMPEGLLRPLSDQEIAHLLTFLSTMGTPKN